MTYLPLAICLAILSPPVAPAVRWDRAPFIISESDRGALCNMQCTRDRHKPICGSDGKLYKSLCAFQRAKCQNPLLEATPRSQCNNASLTRCQEDRAAALAQARGPSHSVYVPECKEDGSFLQVQCHKQTGYCWCATTEGKPVSGTSVLNHTPNCTGPYPARPLWPDLNSSRREEVVRPQPTRESLPVIAQHKEEGKSGSALSRGPLETPSNSL